MKYAEFYQFLPKLIQEIVDDLIEDPENSFAVENEGVAVVAAVAS